MDMNKDSVLVVGAGIGGLAAAIRLAARGLDVTLLERHGWAGGKIRVMDSPAGPVDAGPTVLTLRDVLDDMFTAAGTTLEAHLTLTPLPVLARHFWTDGARLDLFPDARANSDAIAAAFGPRARAEFDLFQRDTRALFDAFDAPIMRAARPSVLGAARAALARPHLLPWLQPGKTLHAMLAQRFSDPHLRQLFGRYATYVGGNPLHAPAVLGLIWQAEAAGVWAVQGGMAALAQALAGLFTQLGGNLRLNASVARILCDGSKVAGVELKTGEVLHSKQVIFNGDPAALAHLLDTPARATPRRQTQPRSLSARVWTFGAHVQPQGLGPDALAYHTVFFADDPAAEFGPLAKGHVPQAPTIYVCAQDRAGVPPKGRERFQFILNAPALAEGAQDSKDMTCQTHPFERLAQFGLHLGPRPDPSCVTMPQDFAQMFPHSQGALYGLSPNGTMATFQRPTARTKVAGLYLAGGGAHPGAGVPMAALSGKHAADAALGDRISAARWRRMATRGGISTGSATTAAAPYR
ncbi:MAG: 1-hydroxycarotenoid 3,4-desaturase CrtD [Roseinatronobacter sp.]